MQPRTPRDRPSKTRRGTTRRGWTLVETLVVLGVVAILISLTLGTLSLGRKRGVTSRCAVQMRQHAAIIDMYCSDHRDWHPYAYTSDGKLLGMSGPVNHSSPYTIRSYAWVADIWHLAAWSMYGEADAKSLTCPGNPRRHEIAQNARELPRNTPVSREARSHSDRFMSTAMFVDPSMLGGDTPRWNEQGYRDTRRAEVLAPSSKALLMDAIPFHDSRFRVVKDIGGGHVVEPAPPYTLSVIACDGAWSERHLGECVQGVAFPEPDRPDRAGLPAFRSALAALWSLKLTPDGVRGRDWPRSISDDPPGR